MLSHDVIPNIIKYLPLKDIGSFLQTCKYNIMIDWESYYKFNIKHNYDYSVIDLNFMKTHGKYLINVTNDDKIIQWFTYYHFLTDKYNYIKTSIKYDLIQNPKLYFNCGKNTGRYILI